MKIFIILIMFLISNSSFAADHLVPEESQFTGIFLPQYYGKVLEVYSETNDENVIARTIVFPSFSPEYALAIKKEDDKYVVVHLQTKNQVWSGYNETENGRDYNVNRCEKVINSDLAKRILAIWKIMLLNTKYNEDPISGLDGTTYHFSMRSHNRYGWSFAGKAWSPEENSKVGLYVDISDRLISFCKDESNSTSNINDTINELNKKLETNSKDEFSE